MHSVTRELTRGEDFARGLLTSCVVSSKVSVGLELMLITSNALISLRDTFAVRYLEAGGALEGLCEVLGLTSVAALKRYERLSVQEYEPDPC